MYKNFVLDVLLFLALLAGYPCIRWTKHCIQLKNQIRMAPCATKNHKMPSAVYTSTSTSTNTNKNSLLEYIPSPSRVVWFLFTLFIFPSNPRHRNKYSILSHEESSHATKEMKKISTTTKKRTTRTHTHTLEPHSPRVPFWWISLNFKEIRKVVLKINERTQGMRCGLTSFVLCSVCICICIHGHADRVSRILRKWNIVFLPKSPKQILVTAILVPLFAFPSEKKHDERENETQRYKIAERNLSHNGKELVIAVRVSSQFSFYPQLSMMCTQQHIHGATPYCTTSQQTLDRCLVCDRFMPQLYMYTVSACIFIIVFSQLRVFSFPLSPLVPFSRVFLLLFLSNSL